MAKAASAKGRGKGKAKGKAKGKPRPTKPTKRTAHARATFLRILEETCNVTESARAAGLCRNTVYDWRGDDEAFARDWDTALQSAADKLEQVAFERAKAGQSERMLEILLKAHRPIYRENKRIEHSGPDGKPIEYRDLSDEEVEARIRAHEAASAGRPTAD